MPISALSTRPVIEGEKEMSENSVFKEPDSNCVLWQLNAVPQKLLGILVL